MPDPTPPNPAPAIKSKAKGFVGKFKGLPPWAYLAALGVGGFVVYHTISKSRAQAATDVVDESGTSSDGYGLNTDTTPYPSGGTTGASYSDPTTGATTSDVIDLIKQLQDAGFFPTGGGTQPSSQPEDHYVPPAITVNIPPEAFHTGTQTQGTPANNSSSTGGTCPGGYPNHNPARGAVGPKSCYKDVQHTECHGGQMTTERAHLYQNGDRQVVSWDPIKPKKKC